jgi:hypothetical protein
MGSIPSVVLFAACSPGITEAATENQDAGGVIRNCGSPPGGDLDNA